jgi:hypothetical protein
LTGTRKSYLGSIGIPSDPCDNLKAKILSFLSTDKDNCGSTITVHWQIRMALHSHITKTSLIQIRHKESIEFRHRNRKIHSWAWWQVTLSPIVTHGILAYYDLSFSCTRNAMEQIFWAKPAVILLLPPMGHCTTTVYKFRCIPFVVFFVIPL